MYLGEEHRTSRNQREESIENDIDDIYKPKVDASHAEKRKNEKKCNVKTSKKEHKESEAYKTARKFLTQFSRKETSEVDDEPKGKNDSDDIKSADDMHEEAVEQIEKNNGENARRFFDEILRLCREARERTTLEERERAERQVERDIEKTSNVERGGERIW